MVWRVKRFFVTFAGKKGRRREPSYPDFAETTDMGENVPMGMTVYFLRHGQTAWNAEKRLQGQTNIPLNDEGRRQAREAGGRLPAIGVCLTSPLQRARETALLALGGEGTPIRDELLLVEQGYGVAEGSRQTAAYDDPQNPMYYYGRAPQDYRPPEGGESFEALCLRARVFLSRCLLPLEGQYDTVLVTAHGALLCAIFRELLGTPMEDFWQNLLPHGGMRVMTVENGCCRLLEAPPSVRP